MKNRILIINPEAATREQFSRILQDNGFHVLLAKTGQEALRTIRDHLVEVVVLDYCTPSMRGQGPNENPLTLEAITDINPLLPLVLTCAESAELGYATSLMADVILSHPVKASALLDAVRTVAEETLRERARRKAGGMTMLRFAAS